MAVDGCGVRELDGVGPLSSLSSEIVSNFEGSSIGESLKSVSIYFTTLTNNSY